MLCDAELDEAELITGVGPGRAPLICTPCCERLGKIQIRSRVALGFAKLCASFVDLGTDPDVYHTDLEIVHTDTAFDSSDDFVRTCVLTIEYNSGSAAILTASDLYPDCDGAATIETYSPEGCGETLLDPPAAYYNRVSTSTYSGDTGTKAGTRDAAIAALSWGAWSDWADLVEIDTLSGSVEAAYLEHTLASSGRGAEDFTPYIANASQLESEIRLVGPFPVRITVSEGVGALGTLTLNRYTLIPDVPQTFSVAPPAWTEGWETEVAVLRCACPLKFAAT